MCDGAGNVSEKGALCNIRAHQNVPSCYKTIFVYAYKKAKVFLVTFLYYYM